MRLAPVAALLVPAGVFGTGVRAAQLDSATASTPPIIRISVERVQLDAVVTDKKGRLVTDLNPAEVDVFLDGRRQQLSELSYVRLIGAPTADARRPRDSRDGQPFPSEAVAQQTSLPARTILFVVDDLSLTASSFDRLRRALRDAVERLEPRDEAQIVTTSGGWSAIRPTTDRRASLEEVAALRRKPWTRSELAGMLSLQAASFFALKRGDDRSSPHPNPPSGALISTAFDATDTRSPDLGFRLDARLALRSIAVLKQAVHALRGLPGRKALIVVSQGLSGLHALGRSDIHDVYWPLDGLYGNADDLTGALKRLAELAARCGVVIDGIDPQGLVTGGLNAEDSIPYALGWQRASRSMPDGGYQPGVLGDAIAARHLAAQRTGSNLQYLADETGGLAFTDTNDLAGALSSILSDLSGYYLVGFEPPPGTFDGNAFHDFEVRVRRPGAKVRTRRGFFAVTDEQVSSALQR